jgi:atypical dual specificity phosphatase
VFVLMGPGGTGKSTLLRTLAGFNAANPSLRTWGEATYGGEALDAARERPALVMQSARLMIASVFDNVVNDLPQRSSLTRLQQRELAAGLLAEAGLGALTTRLDEPVVRQPLGVQRHIAILRLAAANPPLLCLDEPTTGIGEGDIERLLGYIRREAQRRALLVVLHNQAQARSLGGHVALLAGGTIHEACPSGEFFNTPTSSAAREFVRNGNCTVPTPDADPGELDVDAPPRPPLPAPARRVARAASGPRGFLWLKRGVLAGTPRPGIVADLDADLEALKRVGVTVLVSLTRTSVDSSVLRQHGLAHISSPITDMEAPTIEQAKALCVRIAELIQQGEVIAVHCRAGLGRTGTVLACHLIWDGKSALDALEAVRRVEPKWVQSETQVAFLDEFAHAVANEPHRMRPGAVPAAPRHKL